MLKIRVAICEDQKSFLNYIEAYIEDEFDKNSVECSTNTFITGKKLLNSLLSGDLYDVLFLDIELPDMTGLELGKRIRDINSNIIIIFLTNLDYLVYHSFSVLPFRFIRKQRAEIELPLAIKDLTHKFTDNKDDKQIVLRELNSKNVYLLSIQNIVYIEVLGKICTINTKGDSIKLNYRLKDIEKMLAGTGFIKTHRSYLINYKYIFSIVKGAVILDDNRSVPLSRNLELEVKERFFSLINGGIC